MSCTYLKHLTIENRWHSKTEKKNQTLNEVKLAAKLAVKHLMRSS